MEPTEEENETDVTGDCTHSDADERETTGAEGEVVDGTKD